MSVRSLGHASILTTVFGLGYPHAQTQPLTYLDNPVFIHVGNRQQLWIGGQLLLDCQPTRLAFPVVALPMND